MLPLIPGLLNLPVVLGMNITKHQGNMKVNTSMNFKKNREGEQKNKIQPLLDRDNLGNKECDSFKRRKIIHIKSYYKNNIDNHAQKNT